MRKARLAAVTLLGRHLGCADRWQVAQASTELVRHRTCVPGPLPASVGVAVQRWRERTATRAYRMVAGPVMGLAFGLVFLHDHRGNPKVAPGVVIAIASAVVFGVVCSLGVFFRGLVGGHMPVHRLVRRSYACPTVAVPAADLGFEAVVAGLGVHRMLAELLNPAGVEVFWTLQPNFCGSVGELVSTAGHLAD